MAGEKRRGSNNGSWAGGTTEAGGYTYIRKDTTGKATGRKAGAGDYRPRHQVIWEEAHGCPLPKNWLVHHINGVKGDDRPENLEALPRGKHQKLHNDQRWVKQKPQRDDT